MDEFHVTHPLCPQNDRPKAVQPSHAAEAEARRRLPQGISRRSAVQHHGDRPEGVLRKIREGHGGRHHV